MTKTIFLTSGTSYTLPSDWGAPYSVEAIAAGGGGYANSGGGGGGGAYAKITDSDITLSASQSVYIQIGAGGAAASSGTDSWLNASANTAPSTTSQGVLAKAGQGGGGSAGGAGGLSSASVGSTKNSGGAGGSAPSSSGSGGGGAGGPHGPGAQGGSDGAAGGGGGGADGGGNGVTAGAGGTNRSSSGAGTAAAGSNGGPGSNGGGGGGGGSGGYAGGNASAETVWTQTSDSSPAGPGSGSGGGGSGGGGNSGVAAVSGAYGGGRGGGGYSTATSGPGAPGIIVLTYTAAGSPVSISGSLIEGNDALSATATTLPVITGAAALTEGQDSLSATGNLADLASASLTEEGDVLSGAAALVTPISVTFKSFTQDTSYASPVTWSSAAIGSADANRVVVAIVTTGNAVTPPSPVSGVTIQGIAATLAVSNSIGRFHSSMWYASVPTGTTATIVATIPGGAKAAGLALYTLTGMPWITADQTGYDPNTSFASSFSTTFDVHANGAALYGFATGISHPAPTYTGATWDEVNQIGSTDANSAGSFTTASDALSHGFTVSWSGSPDNGALIGASFKSGSPPAISSTAALTEADDALSGSAPSAILASASLFEDPDSISVPTFAAATLSEGSDATSAAASATYGPTLIGALNAKRSSIAGNLVHIAAAEKRLHVSGSMNGANQITGTWLARRISISGRLQTKGPGNASLLAVV